MKKFWKKFVTLLLAACLGFSLIACDPEEERVYYSNEDDPIRFSTLEVDKVFNPFFSSSGTDSNVVGMTQLGMLGNDADGNPTYGDEEACLVKDLDIVTVGEEPEFGQDDTRLTTYYMVLKNDVKFSDGKPVTIKDVLFNLYVYLDMAYTGSSTIYSTDIVGLKEYRTQAASESEQDNFMKQFRIKANARVTALSERVSQILKDHTGEPYDTTTIKEWLQEYQDSGVTAYAHLVEDYEKTLELFKKELETDYSNSLNSYEDTKFSDEDGTVYEGLFTTDVESFLYNENIITWNKKEARLYSEFGDPADCKSWTKEQAINAVFEFNIPDKLDQVINYWQTGAQLEEFIANKELEAAAGTMTKEFPNISGIKFANGGTAVGGAESIVVDGEKYGKKTYAKPEYNADGSVKDGFNEVLSIQIHGVDPKAIWNFAFAVAPLHYYSGTYNGVDYVNEFSIENNNFGVAWNSQTFMETVVNNETKMGVPVGAGPYMASKDSGGTEGVTPNDFYNNGVIYYERNPYYLMGPAKIKKLRLVVVSSTGMLNSLYTNDVDFAEPNAKPETTQEISSKPNMNSKSVETAGYGYIGINAGKIPDLKVRQAIMYCIDTMLCVDYYKNEAEPIYRSMSKSSWAYPEGCTAYYPFIGGTIPKNLDKVDPQYKAFVESKGKTPGTDKLTADEQAEFIQGLMSKAGFYTNSAGIYQKGTHVCRYTFTIAGEGTDHPAWIALFNAGKLLDSFGFKITVKNDAQALKKLTSGSLTVWAAAWGSTIDPDMYQVYHKDSTATSVLNWGYPQIIRNAGNKYDTEVALLEELSRLVDLGRTTEDKATRAKTYSTALDIVMQMAIELPTYQRNDLFAYNEAKIDANTFNKDVSSYKGLTSDLHTLSLVTLEQ